MSDLRYEWIDHPETRSFNDDLVNMLDEASEVHPFREDPYATAAYANYQQGFVAALNEVLYLLNNVKD